MWNFDTKQYETFAVGTTLRVFTRTAQIMSDVWGTGIDAQYWDEETQKVKTAVLDVYEWQRTEPTINNKAEVDATPEVWEKARAFYAKKFYEEALYRAKEASKEIKKGDTVKVVAGRSGQGSVGKVVVEIVRPYRMGWRSYQATKYGIALSDEMIDVPGKNGKIYKNYKDMVWAWAKNCELVAPKEIDYLDCEKYAVAYAKKEIDFMKDANNKWSR